ncbi:MAG: DNA translocase FtsK [Oscillospiraceae bacterium]|jgi:S-DNA-T family DNA segregation ATPase FtsK/SpoIIIE
MAQSKKNAGTKNGSGRKTSRRSTRAASTQRPIRREVGAIVCIFLGLFSFIGYFDVDAVFITFFCGLIKGLIGWGYYIFPPVLFLSAIVLGFHRGRPVMFRTISALLLPLFFGSLVHLIFCKIDFAESSKLLKELYLSGRSMTSGGAISGLLSIGLEAMFSIYGAIPVFFFGFVFFAMSALNITLGQVIEKLKSRPRLEYEPEPVPEPEQEPQPAPVKAAVPKKSRLFSRRAIDIPLDDEPIVQQEYVEEKVGFFNTRPRVKTPDQVIASQTENVEPLSIEEAAAVAGVEITPTVQEISVPPRNEMPYPKTQANIGKDEAQEIASTIEKAKEQENDRYEFPPVTLLKRGSANPVDGREEVALNKERLETTLKSFGVSASIVGVIRGPTVTRYDLELDAGVKLNKLTNLSGDLALSLGVSGVRIAPIPDKISTVGVEVPNKIVSTVYLYDIINSPEFKNSQSKLTFALGKDISGKNIVGNIAKLPHLLIAGTTGSGKSVCMNSLILSLLYKSTPDEVRLIMIDPKMVELGIYNGIPHLYIPVVTDPKKAAGALQWSVVEMLKRYRLFSEMGVRDIFGYNAHQRSIGEKPLPQVVIVIDELADLMLAAYKEVEESICRVAQMGRASGMHLVIATQRPSADVITGLMKANIPSRIAFAVSSALESRIILDTQGAEKLVGSGDMLYFPLGAGKPIRVQGAFVSDEERERVINFIKTSADAQYNEEIMSHIEKSVEENAGDGNGKSGPSNGKSAYDELLPQAVEVIFETKQASVSMLQRRLKLGYSRAARLIDQLEEIGVVGPFEGSKPRQILITYEQWQEMQMNGTAPAGAAHEQMDFASYQDVPEDEWEG